ncbi:hypothetical protein, partial [Cronobacter sakazakii]|uniref:hypothetical protein n=1 Tax=Cronobacter sakazakii TaxID=28141 RepID=UPI001A99D96F
MTNLTSGRRGGWLLLAGVLSHPTPPRVKVSGGGPPPGAIFGGFFPSPPPPRPLSPVAPVGFSP